MQKTVEHSIKAAEASLLMEGFAVSDSSKELCKKLLNGEISLEQYLAFVTANAKGH